LAARLKGREDGDTDLAVVETGLEVVPTMGLVGGSIGLTGAVGSTGAVSFIGATVAGANGMVVALTGADVALTGLTGAVVLLTDGAVIIGFSGAVVNLTTGTFFAGTTGFLVGDDATGLDDGATTPLMHGFRTNAKELRKV
jgi:hypothetical protein